MRYNGALPEVNKITPSRFQVPPRGNGVSQSAKTGPPNASIFFSLPPAKNPMRRLSGDQKGRPAPSVPASGFACNESIGRTHKRDLPSGVEATYARRRPSGDIANPPAEPASMKLDPSIVLMEARMA